MGAGAGEQVERLFTFSSVNSTNVPGSLSYGPSPATVKLCLPSTRSSTPDDSPFFIAARIAT